MDRENSNFEPQNKNYVITSLLVLTLGGKREGLFGGALSREPTNASLRAEKPWDIAHTFRIQPVVLTSVIRNEKKENQVKQS